MATNYALTVSFLVAVLILLAFRFLTAVEWAWLSGALAVVFLVSLLIKIVRLWRQWREVVDTPLASIARRPERFAQRCQPADGLDDAS